MRCRYCRKPISTLRCIVDREFCSSNHKKRFRTSSARALRDAGEMLTDYGDYLAVLEHPERKQAKSGSKAGLVMAGVIGILFGLGLWFLPSAPVPIPTAELRYSLSSNPVSQYLQSILRDAPKINLKQDFRMGLGEWLGAASSGDNLPGSLRTDHLRIWKPTLKLADYQMDFQASIEKRALGWAFRAGDLNNYYGTKLSVSGKEGERAEIERIIVVGGQQLERVRLPIPLSIRPDTLYRVRVRVKGDYFSTSVDGQVIDTWRDRRLHKGGVGFFADKGEQASVRWVSLSEPDGFLSRLLALGFLIHPLYGSPGFMPLGVPTTP